MTILDMEQGSLEWMVARLGLPTASRYDQLLTPKGLKPSASQQPYRAELLAEWLLGQPLEWGTDGVMERGTELEAEARRFYEMDRDVEVRQVGFILRDDGLTGGSPDGLVGADGVLEIKCPMAKQHVRYMLGEKPEHTGQVQGLLHLTGRAWCDVLSYNPELPPVLVRVERDEAYLAALVPILYAFAEQCSADRERYQAHRIPRPWQAGEGGLDG